MKAPLVVIGAGPAGLTAADALTREGQQVVVLEADTVVGGIARTVEYKGFRFDIGGHRFYSRVPLVRKLWRRMLGPDLLTRPRLSRIYYDGRFYDYPLRAGNALRGLGPWRTLGIALSYLQARLHPITPEVTFEDWVVNRFGRRLYETFFKTYTEKVWGMPCSRIGAQWAAQRIKGLSLWKAGCEMLLAMVSRRSSQIRTLIDRFEYPRLGPGMMWEAFRRAVETQGGRVMLSAPVVQLQHDGQGRVLAVEYEPPGGGVCVEVAGVVSTMPLRELVRALDPAPPDEVRAAADSLKYRDFLTVALVLDVAETFPDNWIYVHDPSVKLGRIQNFKNWSPDMVPDPAKTCLGLEYFCFEGDELWRMRDEELIALGTRELATIGLVDPGRVVDGTVVRMPKAYPVYDAGYLDALDVLRRYCSSFTNLALAGRNGLHKYNNQDHAMVTGLLAAARLLGRRADPWLVNVEEDYLEEGADLGESLDLEDLPELLRTQPSVPSEVA